MLGKTSLQDEPYVDMVVGTDMYELALTPRNSVHYTFEVDGTASPAQAADIQVDTDQRFQKFQAKRKFALRQLHDCTPNRTIQHGIEHL